MAVITHHFNKELLPSGYLGVDLFFVISGYVITASLWNRDRSSMGELLLGFYSRRVKRLVPALVFCVSLTGLAALFFSPEPQVSINTGISALFGVSNIYLFWLATDYFGASIELNFFTQTWTLGVEEQFYLVFPFVLWFSGLRRRNEYSAKLLLITIGLLSVISLVLYMNVIRRNPTAAFFLMPYRFWELGAGCFIFALMGTLPSASRICSKINSEILVILIVVLFFLPLSYQVPATVAVVTLTALLMASFRPNTITYWLLTLKPIVYVGLISYSLYLWHWSVLVISRWTIGDASWSVPVLLGLVFILAAISYRFVEKPLRRGIWSKKSATDILMALASTSTVAMFFLHQTATSKISFISVQSNRRNLSMQKVSY